ncbi:MAG: hypothetical protein AB8I08_13975 [Sandaracinaceae bacterium]
MASYLPIRPWPAPIEATPDLEERSYNADAVPIRHWLDETRGGLWVQTLPPKCGDRELTLAFDHMDRRVEAATTFEDPLGLVLDHRFAEVGTPVQRRRIAETFARAQRVASHLIKAQAFVVDTAPQRGALTATLWLVSPSWPLKVFTDRLSAIAWVSNRMYGPATSWSPATRG